MPKASGDPSSRTLANHMQLIFLILNSLGLAGLAAYIYFVLKSLLIKIDNLQGTINEQKETLNAVRERADEFNRLSKGYKQALDDFEQMGKKLEERRQELVAELQEAIQRKDEKLIEFREIEIKEIELKTKSLQALPELEERLQKVISELDTKVKILSSGSLLTARSRLGSGSILTRTLLSTGDSKRVSELNPALVRAILDAAAKKAELKIETEGSTESDKKQEG